ncbi:MAG TPA: universal stress protein [Thermoplasmata archaeon]|nr:universal stress protein [Thermoplasmata archaeon]
MELFSRVLLPISSEFPPRNIFRRAKKFSDIFGSKIFVLYITEEKTLKKVEEVAEPFLTEEQLKEMENNIIDKNKEIAGIIFEKIKDSIPVFKREITYGEFSDEIIKFSEKNEITCILMEFEKECFLNYTLFEKIKIPVWVEAQEGKKMVMGICSNLAPNLRVPEVTLKLAEALGYASKLIYIVDIDEKAEVNEKGFKEEKSIDELKKSAEEFAEKHKKNFIVEIAVGGIEEKITEFAEKLNPDVIIVGREMKKRKLFCKELKMEMVEKIKNSLLLLN